MRIYIISLALWHVIYHSSLGSPRHTLLPSSLMSSPPRLQTSTSPPPNDPFIFESFNPPPSRRSDTSLTRSPHTISANDEDILRPYLHIFRLNPFSTHDGVHGRPTPAVIHAHPHSQARPVMVQFQLDVSGQGSPQLSSVGPVPDEAPAKQEDDSNPRRLLYLDGEATYFSGVAHSGSTPAGRSSPHSHLLVPEQGPEPAQFEVMTWPAAPLFHPIPRSPGQIHPFSQVARSSEEAFQPLTLTPVSEQPPFQMRVPAQSFPTSLAYHAEPQGHERMPVLNAHESGSFMSTASDSSSNVPNGGASVEYGYNSFGYATDGTGYSSGQLPMTPRPPERPSPREYQNPYALPDSRDTSLQAQHSQPFSHSNFPPVQPFHNEPHPHFTTFGDDIPPQPPVMNFHETTIDSFPQSINLDKSDGLLRHPFSPFPSKYPSFLASAVIPSPTPSPEPLLLASRFSPILETSPSRQVSKSPSPIPSRSMTVSPTLTAESVASDASRRPRRPIAKQRRADSAPYIPGRMRQQQLGKPKEHWCTVSATGHLVSRRGSCMRVYRCATSRSSVPRPSRRI